VSVTDRRVAYHASGNAAVRRRIDITRLFTQRPGERMTTREVQEHTVRRVEDVRELLEELTDVGWLRSTHDWDHRIVYWRDEP
jgi:hypothetical protein